VLETSQEAGMGGADGQADSWLVEHPELILQLEFVLPGNIDTPDSDSKILGHSDQSPRIMKPSGHDLQAVALADDLVLVVLEVQPAHRVVYLEGEQIVLVLDQTLKLVVELAFFGRLGEV
jgi:hypothetical protein